MLPSYDGAGIGNIAGTITRAFQCDQSAHPALPALAPTVLDPSGIAGARVIALVVLDGYGSRMSDNGAVLASRVPGGLVAHSQLTSVFPSTTAAALTSLQTGAAPGDHGVAGYTLHLSEAGRVVNMIQFASIDGRTIPKGTIDPATFLPVPTLYRCLQGCGIESTVVSHLDYARSPLTILHSGDTPYAGHRTVAEFVSMVLRETRRPGARFVFGYWAGIDMLAHTYGPHSTDVRLEISLVEDALVRGLLEPLSNAGDDVVVIVTADHGLVETPEELSETLPSLSKAAGKFTRPPTGERRAVGLSTTGESQRLLLERVIGGRAAVCGTADAIAAGLFGPMPTCPALLSRVGDTLVLSRGNHSFPFRPLREPSAMSLGAHGSLTPDEMLVPLLIWRFGCP